MFRWGIIFLVIALIAAALATLKEREQHIYRDMLALEQEHKYLPKEEVKRLADFHGITTGNLYQVRHRATKKIHEYINKNTKKNPAIFFANYGSFATFAKDCTMNGHLRNFHDKTLIHLNKKYGTYL